MARPQKKGLDYFSLDTDHFQDLKVKRLKRNYGCEGYCVYQYILNEIYREEGYYTECTEDFIFDLSEYWDMDEQRVSDIVAFCCRVGLFSAELFEAYGILTSRSIQERFANFVSKVRRNDVEIEKKYALVSTVETQVNTVEIPEKGQKREVYTEESTRKESKVNKEKPPKGGKKKGELSFSAPSLPEISDYVKAAQLNMQPQEFFDYHEAHGWQGIADWQAAARRWASKEQAFSSKPPGKPPEPHTTAADYTAALQQKPPESAQRQYRERMQSYIEAYRRGKRSESIVRTLRTAKRNGNLAAVGLQWDE